MNYKCDQCKAGFKREKSGKKVYRFCSVRCYHAWRAANNITTGQFQTGFIPWNKNKKGLHLSPRTEFKPGLRPANHLPVGSVQIRNRRREHGHRAWVKVAEPNRWRLRAIVEWEKHYGPMPQGLLIHHIDRDTLNDSLTNLAIISRAAHLKEHRPDMEEKRCAGLLRQSRHTIRVR